MPSGDGLSRMQEKFILAAFEGKNWAKSVASSCLNLFSK